MDSKAGYDKLWWSRLALVVYLLIIFASGFGWAWYSDLVVYPDSGEYAAHIKGWSVLCQQGKWQESVQYLGIGDHIAPYPFLTLFCALPFVLLVPHFALAIYLYQAVIHLLLIWGTERCATKLYNGSVGVVAATVFASLLFMTVSVHNCCADPLAGCLLVWGYYAYLRSDDCTSPGWTAIMAALVCAGCFTKWSFFPIYVAPFYLYLLGRYGRQSWKSCTTAGRRLLVIGGVPLVCIATVLAFVALTIRLEFHVFGGLAFAVLVAPFLLKWLSGRRGWVQCWLWHSCFVVPVLVFYWDCTGLIVANYNHNLPNTVGTLPELVEAQYVYDSVVSVVWAMSLEAVRVIREGVIAPIPMGVGLISLLAALFGRRFRSGQISLWLFAVVPLLLYLTFFRNITMRYLLVSLPFVIIAIGAVWIQVFWGLRWLLLSLVITAKIIYCCGWWLPIALPIGDVGCLSLDWMTINRDQRYHIPMRSALSKLASNDYTPLYSWNFMGVYSSGSKTAFLPILHNEWVPTLWRLLGELQATEKDFPLKIGVKSEYVPVSTVCMLYMHSHGRHWKIRDVDNAEELAERNSCGDNDAQYYVGIIKQGDEELTEDRAIHVLLRDMVWIRYWAWVPICVKKFNFQYQLGDSETDYVVLFRFMPYLDSRGFKRYPGMKKMIRKVY